MNKNAGYSGTPLVRKLGLRVDGRVAFRNAPAGFRKTLGQLPPGVTIVPHARGRFDLVILFHREQAALERDFRAWIARINPAGMLWVAWPKKAAKIETDLAFDDTWSGLRFVRRLKDRP